MAETDIKNAATLATNLISVWCEDSTVTTDLHGSNTMTENGTGGITSTTGKQGTGWDFEATDGDYLSITDAAQTGLDLNTDWTVAAWIKLETVGVGNLIHKYTASNYSYNVEMPRSTSIIRLAMSDQSDCGAPGVAQPAWAASAATWYHVVLTVDISSGLVSLYVNNALEDSATGSWTAADGICQGSAPFNIGGPDDKFDGVINQVLLYSKLLTATERTDLYNSGTGIPYEGVTEPAPSVSDSINITESVTVGPYDLANIDTNDSINITESLTVGPYDLANIDVSDSVNITESVSLTVSSASELSISVVDSVNVSESVTVTTSSLELSVDINDTINVTDVPTVEIFVLNRTVSVNDSINVSDSVSIAKSGGWTERNKPAVGTWTERTKPAVGTWTERSEPPL